MKNTKQYFASLLELNPNASVDDINSLIEDISELYDSTTHQTNKVEEWMPSPHTVLEILRLNVKLKDLYFCIESFKTFAVEKGWSVNDNLEAKIISHIKILESNGRISYNINE